MDPNNAFLVIIVEILAVEIPAKIVSQYSYLSIVFLFFGFFKANRKQRFDRDGP